jgi:uncharacterized membrane protein
MVLRLGVTLSSLCLALGLALSLSTAWHGAAETLLRVGILVLLCTPVSRVVVSTIEYLVDRDWRFAALTAIVLLELLVSAVAALMFNRRV